ncbi:Iron-regulated protein A precursor [Rubellimicrobium mesophilum DSM 19309]|uniref:Iron-regulated protein A n=1 Tax=Rubellimicrobium mesophilum DSM 19309 TaxID=442562 RepID=A0A017HTT9_9RHOB|nr:imelysin family protein [Rubellimicrobium mesophilum]EYD77912.1 Iron-regulated protein A precursor [Rubellimicrobium mesophilum DSM 19309]
MRLALALTLLATPALAGVEEAVNAWILPGVAAFAESAGTLARSAAGDCTADALRPAYLAAWEAWAPLADIRLGPSEAGALSIAYWPDERGAGARTLRGLIAAEDPAGLDPVAYAEVSAAARGFPALDLLLGDPDLSGYSGGSYACRLVQTVAADLAVQAEALAEGWQAEAQALTTAGAEGNAEYLSPDEAFRAIYTQALSGLEFSADTRLGRPLGEPGTPRPTRAEAWRSGRSLPNVAASVESAVGLARELADGPIPATEAALDQVHHAEAAIDDPSFQDLADPTARLKLEILQQRIRALIDAMEAEVGNPRGLQPGFNSRDGD